MKQMADQQLHVETKCQKKTLIFISISMDLTVCIKIHFNVMFFVATVLFHWYSVQASLRCDRHFLLAQVMFNCWENLGDLLTLPDLLPLLLFQLVVATLLAFEVKFGVLQLGCQLLAFLLKLLRHTLHLLVVCLHVCQLTDTYVHTHTQTKHSEPFRTVCQ